MASFYGKFLIILLVAVSCKQKPATIINRGDFFYDKANSYRYSKSYDGYGEIKDGYIEVIKGDTLYGIANYYNIPAQELIGVNDLKEPYTLKAGDKLKVPQDGYHRVRSGETLFVISKKYNVKIDHLAKLNNLAQPYNIRVGQVLQIGENARKQNYAQTRPSRKIDQPKTKKPSIISKIRNKLNKFSWPAQGQVVSKFGPKNGGLYNDGINIKAPKGSTVSSAEDGVVAYVGNELRGYGNLIIIKHDGGWITAYAHLDQAQVKKGQEVSKGQKIATVGETGNVTFPQLYFGLRKGREAVNPQNYLSN